MTEAPFDPLRGYPGKLKPAQREWLERLLQIHRGAGFDEGYEDGKAAGWEEGREAARKLGELEMEED